MKTKKFLATLLCLPLLAGCGNNVKAPKFADVGKKISYDALIDAKQKKTNESVLGKSYAEKKLESFEGKGSEISFESSQVVRGKKTISKSETTKNSSNVMKYDAKEATLKTDEKSETKSTLKEKYQTASSVDKSNYSTEKQVGKVKDKFYVIQADLKESEYTWITEVAKEEDGKAYIDGDLKELINNSLTYIDNEFTLMLAFYSYLDDGVKQRFTFYQNNNILTVEYKYSEKNYEYKLADKVVYVRGSESLTKWQIDLTENNWSAKFYQESTSKTEYKENYDDGGMEYAKGDVSNSTSKKAIEYSFVKKDVKQQKADLSKLVGIGF